MDTGRDGQVNKGEMRKFVEDAGVSGWFGKVPSAATDAMMDKFDTDKNGNISWDEFASRADTLIPGGTPGGPVSQQALEERAAAFGRRADTNGDNAASKKEIEAALLPELEQAKASHAGTKAEVGAQLAVHMFDEDKDGKVSQVELKALATDVAREMAAARVGRR
jgi:hypothetical protein